MVARHLPEGFVAGKALAAKADTAVFLAEREADGLPVVLKTFVPRASAAAAARREAEVLRALGHPGIVRVVDCIEDSRGSVLVLECAPGQTLREWVDREGPAVPSALAVSVQLASALAHAHERHIVHRDVGPDNVMVDAQTLTTTLIDFGLARVLGTSTGPTEARSTGLQRGQGLEFAAPEQSGRMNRGWDARTDLYSFGATLYFVLTGRPPFESSDPLELIHAHMARTPADPREHSPELPEPLARIVLRLLRKEPNERYTSARALEGDLAAMRDALERDGVIPDAIALPGMETGSDRLVFPSRLYGRERELEAVAERFARAAAGESGALLIGGDSGMGKSSLVDALRAPTTERSGHLIAGKFDAYRPRPYSAWIAALEALAHQLLLLGDAELGELRLELSTGLGGIAGALVDLVPDLSYVLGEVPEIPSLGPRETQARLALALVRAVQVLAKRERPLVVHLDDMHAADAGSLLLAESVLCAHPAPEGFLLVATYRSEGVDASHPFSVWRERLAARGARLSGLDLGPLDPAATTALLHDTLGCGRDAAWTLAEQIERKTGSSPLLVRELLENLHAQGVLRQEAGTWLWDSERIEAAGAPDGAVGMMLARIDRLDADTVSVLRFCSCAGDGFDPSLLVELGGGARGDVEHALFELCDAGLIVPAPAGFRFAHDKIREAAQALLGDQERRHLHLRIGRFLLERAEGAPSPERASRIADHLNRALDEIDEALRLDVVRINRVVGENALRTGALDEAVRSLGVACDLLRDSDWESERALGFEVEALAADACFHAGKYEAALELLDGLEARELEQLEWLRVEAKRILVFAVTRSPEEAARRAVCAFRRIGIRWSLPVSRWRFALELRAGRRALERARFGLDWRRADAPDRLAIARNVLSVAGGGAASRTDSRLSTLLCYASGRSNSRFGFIANPGYSLAACAFSEITDGQDPRRAAALAESSMEWKGLYTDAVFDLRHEFLLHAIVYPWIRARKPVLRPLTRVAEQALELGDPEFAYYAEINQAVYLALGGESVGAMVEQLRALAEGVRRRAQRYPEAELCARAYELLCLPQAEAASTCAARVREMEPAMQTVPPSGAVYCRTLCMQVLCIYGHYELAFAQSESLREHLFRVVPFVHVADHTFYRGLAAAALAREASGRERRAYRRVLRESAKRLRRWSTWGPDFPHMSGLLEAERAALRDDLRTAIRGFDTAAKGAEEQGFLHHAALTHERKASLLERHRRAAEADLSRRAARALYAKWGCDGKSQGPS